MPSEALWPLNPVAREVYVLKTKHGSFCKSRKEKPKIFRAVSLEPVTLTTEVVPQMLGSFLEHGFNSPWYQLTD